MKIQQIWIVVWIIHISVTQCAGKCYCGFGGVCRFHPDSQEAVPTDCDKCNDVSKGLYVDCHVLKNHCESSPCLNGSVCVMTYGGFFCKCPKEFYGHMCESRRRKTEKFEVVSGPRVWYQVNRVWGGLTKRNQIIHFAVESPGDGMQVQVRFDDGRVIVIMETDLRLRNEKQHCIEEVRTWPKSCDPKICETLPDGVLYSTSINVAFFDDKFAEKDKQKTVTVNINKKNVTEGRLDDIHITVLNWKRITYSQYYRIHSVFDIWPKCLFKIDFIGCSVDNGTPIVHEGEKSIYLKSIRIPTNNCSVGRIKKMKWSIKGRGIKPFISRSDKEDVYVGASQLLPGRHYIDFLMIVEGRPPYHGHPDLAYNYGRCWIKIVDGEFKVGIEGGNSRAVLCIKPLSLRMFSYNSNYDQKDFASIWRCDIDGLEVCDRQRFLGPKILFRTLPCGITLTFKAMVVDVPTGSKTFLTVIVKTTTHVDDLICSCTYNCYPAINPQSTTKMQVEINLLSSNSGAFEIKWLAKFAGESWDIERFIVPETHGTAIEIFPNTFGNLTARQTSRPYIKVTAYKNDLYCTIHVDVMVPMKEPAVALSPAPIYLEDVHDERYKIFLLEHPVLNNNLPISYEVSEAITPNSTDKEIVEFILGDVQQFSYVKLANPSYITSINHMGVRSPEHCVPKLRDRHEPKNYMAVSATIDLIETLALNGNDNVALTEMLYVSRTIAMSDKSNYYDKMRIMEVMNYIVNRLDRSSSSSIVSAKLNEVLNTMNRLMLISNLTEPPFNISIYPWKVPPIFKGQDMVVNWISMYTVAAETLHTVIKYYYYFVSKRLTAPTDLGLLKLMFGSLLRLQLAERYLEQILKHLEDDPVVWYHKKREAAEMVAFIEKAIVLLLKTMDFHVDGHTGNLDISIGSTTAAASVVPVHAAPELSRLIFNEYQRIRLSVDVQDTTLAGNDLLCLGVFLEVPMEAELTTRVHTLLFTHLTQRNVKGVIEVQLNVRRDRIPDQVSVFGIARRSLRRPVTLFKLELDSELDVVHHQIVRQVVIHFESNSSLRSVLTPGVPQVTEVEQAPSTNNSQLVMIFNYSDTFLGVLPGIDVNPEVPISFKLHMTQFICVQKVFDDPTDLNSMESKTICGMEQAAQHGDKVVTCSCKGSGEIETYSLALRVTRILADINNTKSPGRRNYEQQRAYNYVILVYPLLVVLSVLFAWWRDKKSWKKEFLQPLEDSFPDDRFPYILCVRTGKKPWAGTNAHVGIQLFGSISASRVHILRSKSYKVLEWGQEDWFMIFTPTRLGKLHYMILWQDYSQCCHGWYCSRVLVYDVDHQVWSRFIVEKWFTLTASVDDSRTTLIRSQKYLPEKEIAEKFTFTLHFRREIENTHSLFSPITKHPRFVNSYRMRACLTLAFVLTLVTSVILMDSYFETAGHDLEYGNILLISLVSTALASIPFTIATCFFTRSVLKMKKTKTLDLNWLESMKTVWNTESSHFEVGGHAIHHEHSDTESIRKHVDVSPDKHSKSQGSSMKGFKFSNQSYTHSMSKWMGSSIYRPIRVDDYGFKRKEMIPYICGWGILTLTITANLIFLICWISTVGWLEGRSGLLLVTVALIFEILRSSLVVLLISLFSVYFQKRSNIEINCLDLTGLRNGARIPNHATFMIALTKPYYHPLTTEAVQVLYKKKRKMLMYIRVVWFLFLCCVIICPAVLLSWKRDTQSLYRIQLWSKSQYKEPAKNNFTMEITLFENVRTVKDLNTYLLGTVMPITRVFQWYNNKMIRPEYADIKKRKHFFVDRTSRVHGRSSIRILQANNNTKTYIAAQFKESDLPIFSLAQGQYDLFAPFKTTYNRWNQVIKRTESTVIRDILLFDGLLGVTGFFYPSSIGDKLILHTDVKQKDEGISKAMKKLLRKDSRTIIIDTSLIHPMFSPDPYNPMYGFTTLQILFENCASGIYTGSITATFFYSVKANYYLRLCFIMCALSMFFFVSICLRVMQDGLKSSLRNLLFWVLLLGCVSCWVAAGSVLAIHFYILNQTGEREEDDTHPVDYHGIIWLKQLSEAGIGAFILLGTTAWMIWWVKLTGLIRGNIELGLPRCLAAFVVYSFFASCVGSVYFDRNNHQLLILERIDKNARLYKSGHPSALLFVIFSLSILWPLQKGVVIYVTTAYIQSFYPPDPMGKKINFTHYVKHSRIKRFPIPEEVDEKREVDSQEDTSNQGGIEPSTQPRPSLTPNPTPTARLDHKMSLWK